MTTTRNRILEGARAVVAMRGDVREVVVADLLEAGGVSRRTFYKQFRSAEDAIAVMYEHMAEDMDRQIEQALSDAPDPLRAILNSLDAYLSFVLENDPLVTVLHAEAVRPGSLLGPARGRVLDRQTRRLADGVRDTLGVDVDPWVWLGLFLAVEGLVIEAGTPFDSASRSRVRAVIRPMFVAVIAAVEHLPRSSSC